MFGRRVVFQFTAGSHNRNLNDQDSDVDYKYFVLPTKEDLYSSKVFKKFEANDHEDVDVQDVRRLEKLFYQSNMSYLDLLFSINIKTFGFSEAKQLIALRDSISRMNLPNLYSSSIGMFTQNMKTLHKPTSEKTKALIETNGYHTKKAMLAYHFISFLVKFHEQQFHNYGRCIWYEGEEREFMLAIKRGDVSFNEFVKLATRKEKQAKSLETDYKTNAINNKTLEQLKNLLRRLVFHHTL
ncbi:nucleotidyltransferase domain-containing protein [Bacillus shivajii]|nr:nucleotidyltransferase domain-containing protein [Bacillus shivajii]UCZ55360.1 nucleotidyltransferase domain-containing protein [Bacillus shivajii]